jgi:hypothetical protein
MRCVYARPSSACLWEGNGQYRVAALHGASAWLAEERRPGTVIRPSAPTGLGRIAATRQTADVQAEKGYLDAPPGFSTSGIAIHGGARTELGVPMLKDDDLVGAIVIYRQEVRPGWLLAALTTATVHHHQNGEK